MPDDARPQFAQRLGEIMAEHRNGSAEGKEPNATEAEADVTIEQEESDPNEGREAPEAEDQELLDAKETLKPSEGDSSDVLSFKKEKTKMVDKALRKAAEARKQAQGDPDAARKAMAFDALINAPDAGAALAQLKGAFGGQNQQPNVAADEKALREWFGNDEGFDKMMQLMSLYDRKHIRPDINMGMSAINNMATRSVESDWDKIAAQYDGAADEFKEETFKTARELRIPLQKALLLASDGAIVTMKKQASDKNRQRKSLSTPTQGGAAGAYSKPKPKPGGSTPEDRVRNFAQGVRKAGLELPWNRFGKA